MPSIHSEKTVSCTPAQMYALVNDVGAYAEFLPWCEQSVVHQQDDEQQQASLTIVAGGIMQSFTTHNRLQPDKMIELHLVEGPFKYLHGFWRFNPLQQDGQIHCRVSLDLEFEFTTKLLTLSLSLFFHRISTILVNAFCERAKVLYGCDDD